MQSTRTHVERIPAAALDEMIEWCRDQACREVRCGSKALAAGLRNVSEFLLRPTRGLVAGLAAIGCSVAQKTRPEPMSGCDGPVDQGRLDVATLDHVIKAARDRSRRLLPGETEAFAAGLRALNEFLLRPVRAGLAAREAPSCSSAG